MGEYAPLSGSHFHGSDLIQLCIRYDNFHHINLHPGGDHLDDPPRFFMGRGNDGRVYARSFLHAFLNILSAHFIKNQSEVTSGQVTRPGQMTLPQKHLLLLRG